jgi:hypothetical protein
MKKVSLFFMLLSAIVTYGQKKYLVEYDRINNSENYFEIVQSKGDIIKKPIKKPNLIKGDLVKIKAVNMNPLVFKLDIDTPDDNNEKQSNSANLLNGFAGIMGEMNGAFGQVSEHLSELNTNRLPDISALNRGSSKRDEARTASLVRLVQFQNSLEKTYKMLAAYKKAISDVYSTELTKEEISTQLKVAISEFKIDDYNAELRSLDKQYELLRNDSLIYDNERSDLDSIYKTIDKDVENSYANPNNSKDLLSLIESSKFSAEKSMVIGYESGSFREVAENGLMNYSIRFRRVAPSLDDNPKENDDLLQSHDLSLSVQSPSKLTWASGFFLVSPFKGYNNYKTESVDFDSARVVSGSSLSPIQFSMGTSLLYNVPSRGMIIPQVMFGASVGFSGMREDKPVNFLIGGGMRLKKFPFISFSAGISFCQNTKLKNGYSLGDSYKLTNYNEGIEYITEKTFSPGYFFGLNINL